MEIRKTYSSWFQNTSYFQKHLLVCKMFVGESRGKCDDLGLRTVINEIVMTWGSSLSSKL